VYINCVNIKWLEFKFISNRYVNIMLIIINVLNLRGTARYWNNGLSFPYWYRRKIICIHFYACVMKVYWKIKINALSRSSKLGTTEPELCACVKRKIANGGGYYWAMSFECETCLCKRRVSNNHTFVIYIFNF